MSRAPVSGLVLGVVLVGTGAAATAGPYSTVPSAADQGDPIDVHGRLSYAYELERSTVKRERVGAPGVEPTDPTPDVKDLLFASARHVITPAVEIGVFHDVWIAAALPIVIGQTRTLSFDQRSTPCSFADVTAPCINRTNSTTILDGILPVEGFDAGDAAGFPTDSDTIFRGPTRGGLDQIHLGAGVAPMNQQRDDTKPTWKIQAELRVPVGKVATFDRDAPDRHKGVGKGVYELVVSTSVARRIGWAEPFFALWWQAPLAAKSGSPFADPGFGARSTLPQQEAGVHFGFEAIVVDRPLDATRVGLELASKVAAKFEGRAYTPMWEVFAYAGDIGHAGPLVLDRDPVAAGLQAQSHPGITNVENYLELGAQLAVRAEIGPHVHIAALASIATATRHVISFDDAGDDSADDNDVIDPGSEEVNPLHVPLVDLVGHRYLADENLALSFGVEARVLF